RDPGGVERPGRLRPAAISITKIIDDHHQRDHTMKTSPALPSWRSLLFVPATSDRFVESALRQPADALQIDLEDSVAPDQKQLARERLPAIAAKFSQAGYGVVVRLNRPWRQLVRDMEAAVQPEVEAVCLPKVPDAAFVRAVA